MRFDSFWNKNESHNSLEDMLSIKGARRQPNSVIQGERSALLYVQYDNFLDGQNSHTGVAQIHEPLTHTYPVCHYHI